MRSILFYIDVALMVLACYFLACMSDQHATLAVTGLFTVSMLLHSLHFIFGAERPSWEPTSVPVGEEGDEPVRISYALCPSTGTPKKKHPQMILAMAQDYFDTSVHFRRDVNVLVMEDFLSWPETYSALAVLERERLERDAGYRQLLPYIVVRQIGDDGEMRYFTYRRTSKVGEQRLAGKVSIGIGGHVDAVGTVYRADGSINVRRTLMECALREIGEELIATDHDGDPVPLAIAEDDIPPPTWANLFLVNNEDVQRMHVGIVMFLDLPAGVVVETAEEELVTLGMLTMKELSQFAGGELEAWSHLLADHLLADHILDDHLLGLSQFQGLEDTLAAR